MSSSSLPLSLRFKPPQQHQRAATHPSIRGDGGPTKQCYGCAETRPLDEKFPSFSTCKHLETACMSCLFRHIQIRLRRDPTWDACTCPICNRPVPERMFKEVLGKEAAFLFDGFISFLRRLHQARVRACPSCGRERFVLPWTVSQIQCSKCSDMVCMNHGVKWHKGVTCREYDSEHIVVVTGMERLSMDFIDSMTKECPHCHTRVAKGTECGKRLQMCKWLYHVAEMLADYYQVHTVPVGGIGMSKY
jgi:hypothetical protein